MKPHILVLLTLLSSCSAPPLFSSWELPKATVFSEKPQHFTIQNSQCSTFDKGIIFYPGGLVSPGAYIPLLAKIARQCHFVVLAKMPLDLAVLNSGLGQTLKKQYVNKSSTWAIGGHSLGGAMAAEQINNFAGLFFLAAYVTSEGPLKTTPKPVLSVSGSRDGLATPAKINTNKKFLPTQTTFVEIKGGNHAQFGDYGPQNKDLTAKITLEQQQEQTATAVNEWLKNVIIPAN